MVNIWYSWVSMLHILTVAGHPTSSPSQGNNTQKVNGEWQGLVLQHHVLWCGRCHGARPWIVCGGVHSTCAELHLGKCCTGLHTAGTTASLHMATLGYRMLCWYGFSVLGDVVGWIFWVRFLSGASVKGDCVFHPSPTGQIFGKED